MTLAKLLSLSLARAGQRSPSSDQTDRARDYANIFTTQIGNGRAWRFLYKTSTFTTTAATRGPYDLATDVKTPLQFWDQTNDRPLDMKNPEDVIKLDPDEDSDGTVYLVAVTGVNTTTGIWQVDLYNTPSAANDVIKYRYYAEIAEFTSDDDASELAALGYPRFMQPVLMWAVAATYREDETGDATAEWEQYNIAYAGARRVDGSVDIPPQTQLGRASDRSLGLVATLDIQEDA